MTRLLGASLLSVLVLAGCGVAGPSSPVQSAAPTPGPSPTALETARPTEVVLPSPTLAAVCPNGPLTIEAFLAADSRCYVTDEIAVVGWWDFRRTDDPAREANLDYMLRGSMPFGALSPLAEDFLLVDEQDIVPAGGWPGGVHWATVTGYRSTEGDRACHYDTGDDGIPTRHCPSYLIASTVVESDPPAAALTACATLDARETSWVDVEVFTAYPPACFGTRDMTVRGWLDIRYLITGWELPWGISPGWLWVPIGPWTVVAPGSNPETSAALVVYSDPARRLDLQSTNRWVLLTGHYGDAKAGTCRVEYAGGYDAARDGPRIPDAFARRVCAAHLVVTSVRNASP